MHWVTWDEMGLVGKVITMTGFGLAMGGGLAMFALMFGGF